MKIAIVTGGETGERDISIKSAKNIEKLIDFATTVMFVFPEDKDKFTVSADTFNLAIPVIHGRGGEDGEVQKLFKEVGIPFVFSGVSAHATALDKKFTKEIAQSINIISPKEINYFPIFAKPRYGGSSITSQLCSSEKELTELLSVNPAVDFLREEPIVGREFTVGIIEHNKKTVPLPVVEIVAKGGFFDFESKYDSAKLANEICPAQIDSSLWEELQRQALIIHIRLGVRHLSRSDFIVTSQNKIYFLEINTIPGMTDTSLIPKMVSVAGLSLREIFKDWCLS